MNVPIQSPCPITWGASSQCGKSRFCHQCTKDVYNLSNMTEPEAQNVLDRKAAGDDVCVSYIGDRLGNVVFFRNAAALVLAAASLLQAQVALADGAMPTLTPVDTVPAVVDTVIPNSDSAVLIDAGVVDIIDPLADVTDSDCDKPVDPNAVQSDIGTLEPEVPEYEMWAGGI